MGKGKQSLESTPKPRKLDWSKVAKKEEGKKEEVKKEKKEEVREREREMTLEEREEEELRLVLEMSLADA